MWFPGTRRDGTEVLGPGGFLKFLPMYGVVGGVCVGGFVMLPLLESATDIPFGFGEMASTSWLWAGLSRALGVHRSLGGEQPGSNTIESRDRGQTLSTHSHHDALSLDPCPSLSFCLGL